ncbi:MAG: hypothetical protein Q7S35_12135 [Candidatus Limnocylindrales bacterium]|nr:hypothetical protein [Candidatus Limnocylindrales bacterium]
MLEVLSDFQVTIPELPDVERHPRPVGGPQRRCLCLHLNYSSVERGRAILLARVPDLSQADIEKARRALLGLPPLDDASGPVHSDLFRQREARPK